MQRTSHRTDRNRLRYSGGALAHSLSGTAWRESLEMRRSDPTIAVAVRVGVATLIALVGGGLLGHQEVAGFAALGALSSAFLRYEPFPRLATKLACVGVGLVAFAAFGATLGAVGLTMWLQILLLSVAAGVSFWLLTAFRITGPGPVILIFAAAGAAGFAENAADVGLAASAAAVGSAIGWIVAMLPALSHPHSPARIAVARALASVAALESPGAADVATARQHIARAREVIALGGDPRMRSHSHELLALLDAAEKVVDGGSHDTAAARRADFHRFEAELRKVRRDIDIPRSGASVHAIPSVRGVDRFFGFFVEGVRRLGDRVIVIGVARVVVASLVAGWIAAALGMAHPLWATMGAMAALQGANYRQTVQRAIQRLIGNALGAVLAVVLLVLDLGYWPLVVVIVVLQTVTEMVVTRNYALASVFVTAMALMLTGLGTGIGADVALSRVLDTLVGVVVGVIVAALTLQRGDRAHLTEVTRELPRNSRECATECVRVS
ncbi:fusaric acid resistance family protein [Rhodococcus sp. SMB37]|uniref:FUSC family protein n=1 Tax=Rhodococcus sp. SMB37 TaxID=2512213 RepID=UPI001047A247|nr:FUSC family protein [Rhodococcus sp. SMB37]TCN42260.1 fusaric acid resistance family protein [Rhodococcus sp. SMB37]